MIMDRLYGGVCYAGIDTDPELKYPKGAGRVAFSNQQSYIAAISARFVQLQHNDIDKRVSGFITLSVSDRRGLFSQTTRAHPSFHYRAFAAYNDGRPAGPCNHYGLWLLGSPQMFHVSFTDSSFNYSSSLYVNIHSGCTAV